MFVVTVTSPSVGQGVGDNFNILVTVSDDGTSSGSFASETRRLQAVSAQVGADGPALLATPLGTTWEVSGHLPASAEVGQPVTITVIASGIAQDATNTNNTKPISSVTTVRVTAAPSPPNVTIAQFDNDETVARLPFRVPLLSGFANDLAGVTKVQYTIDDGPRQDMDVVSGTTSVNWSVADVEFGAGQHIVTVIATNVFGQEGSLFTTVTVRVNTPPPPSTVNPLGLSFTPTFRHKKWHNNVDLIAAGGPNGFNVRYDAIDSDLRQAATVVGQVDTALNQTAGIQPGQQVLTSPIDLFSFGSPGSILNGWFFDSTGAAHPDGGSGGGQVVIGLSLPDDITLTSFRAMGLFNGIRMSVTLFRGSLADRSQTNLVAQITERTPGLTNPYDLQVPTVAVHAAVDNNRFHYYILVASDLVGSSDQISVATVQLGYTAT